MKLKRSLKPAKVAVSQIRPRLGKLEHNISLHREHIREAAAAGAEMIVFPELSISGYSTDPWLAEFSLRRSDLLELGFSELSRRLDIVFGFPEEDEHFRYFNSAAVFSKGRLAAVHRKLNLVNYGVWQETKLFAPGEAITYHRANEVLNSAILICNDLWNPGIVHAAASSGVSVIIAMVNSLEGGLGEPASSREMWLRMNQFYASVYGVYVVFANFVGSDENTDFSFWGNSHVVNPFGEIVCAAGGEHSELIFAQIDPKLIQEKRLLVPTLRNHDAKLIVNELDRAAERLGEQTLSQDSKDAGVSAEQRTKRTGGRVIRLPLQSAEFAEDEEDVDIEFAAEAGSAVVCGGDEVELP